MAGTSVGEALARGGRALSSVSETAGRDAQVLLAEMTGRPREWLIAHPEAAVASAAEAQFAAALHRLMEGEPLPYVLGWSEFFGRRFRVTPDVLIPRPETELLVERGLQTIDCQQGTRLVIDIGAGSGCVGITLALERLGTRVVAVDISHAALRVAKQNAARLGAANLIALARTDLSAGLRLDDAVVLANLPYVASGEAAALRFEPHLATDGGASGMEVIRRLLQQLAGRRPRRTTALLELGAGQGRAAVEMALGLCQPTRAWMEPDLAGHDRILVIEFEELASR